MLQWFKLLKNKKRSRPATHKDRNMKQVLFIGFVFIACLSVKAQTELRLPDAINIALKNSLDLQMIKNTVEANTILNNYGVAGGLPLVTANVNDNEQVSSINQKLNTGESISRDAATNNSLSVGVTGSILLYNGSRVVATKTRLALLQKQSEGQLNGQVQNLIASVATAYYDIIRQQSYIRTIERSIEAGNQQLQIVKARQDVGLANNADLFQAQIDLNALIQTKRSQYLIVDQAKTELLRLLSLRTDSLIAVNDTIIVDTTMQMDAILNSLNKNADIISAQEQVRINEQLVKETAALRYPSIRGTTGFNFVRNQSAAGQLLLNQNYGPYVGVSIGIPIYNGSIYRRQQQVASIDVRNAELSKQLLIRDYSSQVVKSYQSYASALTQLKTEQENYNLSGRLLDLVLERFRYRVATIVDVKNAQQSFEASGFRLTNLNFAAKSAEIELKRLANQLSL
jgi:outer membrane protein